MDKSKLITTIIGAVVMILGITGVVTADEGTALSANAIDTAQGILGLIAVITGIYKRRKGKAPAQIDQPAQDQPAQLDQ